MNIKTITIKDLEEGYIGIAKDCHLCGEAFAVDMYSVDTICPKCKEVWQAIIKERCEDEGVKGK